MLGLDQYELIRTASRVYGKSISQIKRDTGHSRKTIRKALNDESWEYKKRTLQPFPILGPYLKIINQWIKKDKLSPKKQRHTARRIFNRLVSEHNFTGAESTVRRYVKTAKRKFGINSPKAFIPCDPIEGAEAEIDWGTATAILADKEVKLKFFCMRSKYSGKHFVKFYPCEKQQIFLDAHICAFDFFGGIFPVLIYDNLTVAVRKILRGKQRVEQESFSKFRAYYNFEARFTNPASGNEKGGVEGAIAFVRRNNMVPIPKALNIDELNKKLIKQCWMYGKHKISGRNRTVNERFENEKQHLIKVPKIPFSNIQIRETIVDKYATVIVDTNRYSVPTKYVGLKTNILLEANNVTIFQLGKKIAVHPRNYGKKQWCIISDHYLDLIKQRPQSFASARAIRQWHKVWPDCLNLMFEKMCLKYGQNKGTKDFVSLLILYRTYSSSEIEAAVDLALENKISNTAGIKHILLYTKDTTTRKESLPNWQTFPAPDTSIYAQLGSIK